MNWYWSMLIVRISVCESTEPESSIGPYFKCGQRRMRPAQPEQYQCDGGGREDPTASCDRIVP